MRETSMLANSALLVLLDGKAYAVQRQGPVDLVRSLEASNALELSAKVNASLSNLAARPNATTSASLGCSGG